MKGYAAAALAAALVAVAASAQFARAQTFPGPLPPNDFVGNLGGAWALPTPVPLSGISTTLRSTGANVPASGSGIEMFFDGSAGRLLSYNRTGGAFLPEYLDGNPLILNETGGNPGYIESASDHFFASGRPVCHPRAHGATGGGPSGNHDDSAAFAACLAQAGNLPPTYGLTVDVVPGDYCVSTVDTSAYRTSAISIHLHAGAVIDGNCPGIGTGTTPTVYLNSLGAELWGNGDVVGYNSPWATAAAVATGPNCSGLWTCRVSIQQINYGSPALAAYGQAWLGNTRIIDAYGDYVATRGGFYDQGANQFDTPGAPVAGCNFPSEQSINTATLPWSTSATVAACALAQVGGQSATISNAVWASTAGGQTTLTVGTDLTGHLSPGQSLYVQGVASTGGSGAGFNGLFPVAAVASGSIVVAQPAAASPGTFSSGGTALVPAWFLMNATRSSGSPASCTTAASGNGPTAASYSTPIGPDGSCTWQLVGPAGEYGNGLHIMGSNVFVNQGDVTGPFAQGIRIDMPNGGLLTTVRITDATLESAVNTEISIANADDVVIGRNLIGNVAAQNGDCVAIGASATGDVKVRDNTIIYCQKGVEIAAGPKNVQVDGNTIGGAGTGVAVDASAQSFAVLDNPLGSAEWGANTTDISIGAGASSGRIAGNTCTGGGLSNSSTAPTLLSGLGWNPGCATGTTVYGGAAANAALNFYSTANGSPSGDSLNFTAQSITFNYFTGGGAATFNLPTAFNLGLALKDSGDSQDLTLASASSLTGGRVLTFNVNNANATLALNGNFTVGAALALAGTNGTTMTFPSASDTVMGLGAAQTVSGAKTFQSGNLILAGSGSGTTVLNAAAAASGTLTLPAATDTLAALAASQALTNKTYNGLSITSTTGTLAITNGKTLTVLNSLAFSGTDGTSFGLPSASDNLVGLAATQTLTNKTISGGSFAGMIGGSPTYSGAPLFTGLSGGTCSVGLALDSGHNLVTDACPGSASSISIASTAISGGTSGYVLYDNGGNLGNFALGTNVQAILGNAAVGGGTITTTGTGFQVSHLETHASVTQGSTVALALGAPYGAIVSVADTTNNKFALFATLFNQCVILANPYGIFACSSSPTSTNVGLAYASGNQNLYTGSAYGTASFSVAEMPLQ